MTELTLLLNYAGGDPADTIVGLATGFKGPGGDGVLVQCSPSPLEDPECADETDPLKVVFGASSGTTVNRGGTNGFEVNRVICSNCVEGVSDRLFTPGVISPVITYEPRADFNGTDTFSYTIEDADGQQSSATVNVTVVAVNDPPGIVAGFNGTLGQRATQSLYGRYQAAGAGECGPVALRSDKEITTYSCMCGAQGQY